MVISKKHRLDPMLYNGNVIVAVTICTLKSEPWFLQHSVVGMCTQHLTSLADRFSIDVHVWMFMPDHCHLIIQGHDLQGSILCYVDQFKQRTGYWFSHNTLSRKLWQKGYYDHVICSEESLERHMRYILENPVRAGITVDWFAYPNKGSTVYDLLRW